MSALRMTYCNDFYKLYHVLFSCKDGISWKNSSGSLVGYLNRTKVIAHVSKGVRTRIFWLIISLLCFDPGVLLSCLAFCSASSSN